MSVTRLAGIIDAGYTDPLRSPGINRIRAESGGRAVLDAVAVSVWVFRLELGTVSLSRLAWLWAAV